MKHTPPPWFVNDMRASKLRELGWAGEYVDRILICSRSPSEVARTQDGTGCIIARITFDNRPEELGDSNLADAEHLVRCVNERPSLIEALRAADVAFQLLADHEALFGVGPAVRKAADAARKKISAALLD